MLDVSKEKLNEKVDLSQFKSMLFTFNKDRFLTFNKIMSVFGIVFLVVLFLPWTQNVQGNSPLFQKKNNYFKVTFVSYWLAHCKTDFKLMP
ncbi:hypothetical protein [Psychroflexus gondwanensis]|uniref:hypothetical protein n=1 Tax=Psychroflexus gondwanensis TaxID=251 RepID=UPI001CC1EB7E|nr:hypothetical protein [Psychroflexus gondwanensis]